MADERSFALVGNFKDNITPSLKKLNTQLSATAKSFEKMQKMVRPIAKDMAIMADAAGRMNKGYGRAAECLRNQPACDEAIPQRVGEDILCSAADGAKVQGTRSAICTASAKGRRRV